MMHQLWRVHCFRNVLFALAALLWLPASAHCQLEKATGLEFFACQNSGTSGHAPCSDDACAVEKSHYVFKAVQVTPPLPGPLLALLPQLVSPAPPAPAFVPISTAPPELSPRWPFVLRTAPSPRAPSVA